MLLKHKRTIQRTKGTLRNTIAEIKISTIGLECEVEEISQKAEQKDIKKKNERKDEKIREIVFKYNFWITMILEKKGEKISSTK